MKVLLKTSYNTVVDDIYELEEHQHSIDLVELDEEFFKKCLTNIYIEYDDDDNEIEIKRVVKPDEVNDEDKYDHASLEELICTVMREIRDLPSLHKDLLKFYLDKDVDGTKRMVSLKSIEFRLSIIKDTVKYYSDYYKLDFMEGCSYYSEMGTTYYIEDDKLEHFSAF
jgi:hypothetical protein